MSPVNSQDVFLASIPEVPSNTCKDSRGIKKKKRETHKNNQEGIRIVLHKIMHQNAASQLENLISHKGQKTRQSPVSKGFQKQLTGTKHGIKIYCNKLMISAATNRPSAILLISSIFLCQQGKVIQIRISISKKQWLRRNTYMHIA